MDIKRCQNQQSFKGYLAGYDRKKLEKLGLAGFICNFEETVVPKIGNDKTAFFIDVIDGKHLGMTCKQDFCFDGFMNRLRWGKKSVQNSGGIHRLEFLNLNKRLEELAVNLYSKCMQSKEAADFKILERIKKSL